MGVVNHIDTPDSIKFPVQHAALYQHLSYRCELCIRNGNNFPCCFRLVEIKDLVMDSLLNLKRKRPFSEGNPYLNGDRPIASITVVANYS